MPNLLYKLPILLFFQFFGFLVLHAQNVDDYWTDIPAISTEEPAISSYRALQLDADLLLDQMDRAPQEFTDEVFLNPLEVVLPMPDGTMQYFIAAKSFITEDGLAAKYPWIKSYIIKGIDAPTSVGRILSTTEGISIHILSEEGSITIEPAERGGDEYIAYYREYIISDDVPFVCGHTGEEHKDDFEDLYGSVKSGSTGEVLRVFRIGIAATGEFSQNQGGTGSALNAILDAVSYANVIFERDLSVRVILIDDNDEIIFPDPDTDPYTDGTSGYQCLDETPGVFNNYIGASNYDIAHTFTGNCSDVGGVAFLGSVCDSGSAGMTCASGDYYDTMLHEIGHQFRGSHTFSNCNDSNQLSENSAYEPGSGSTLLSYAGLCSGNNVTSDNDFYYHTRSLRQINNFLNNDGDCYEAISTGNTEPELEILSGGFYIPISTPFELEAIATDADDDALTYCWEQYNLGPTTTLGSPVGNAPSFRSFKPTSNPLRSFPRLSNVLFNTTNIREVLPTYSRNLTFVCTVRDNFMGSGGMVYEQVSFNATATAGPFEITHPNETQTYVEGQTLVVEWDVANTDLAPVNCSHVDIYLSANFGYDFPFVLAENTPNDGAKTVTIPFGSITTVGRIKIKASDNIFYDINDKNIKIQAGDPTAINNMDDLQNISVMPNPATDQLSVVFEEPVQEVATVSMYDLQGKLLKSKAFESVSGAIEFDVTELPEALYILKVNTASKQFVDKVLIHR